MIVKDIMRDNDPDITVMVDGVNPHSDTDPYHEQYYHGKLGAIPEDLQRREVLQTAWSLGTECHIIEIAYIRRTLFTARECAEAIDAVSVLSNAIVRIVEETHDRKLSERLGETQDRLLELMKMIETQSESDGEDE